jgi:NTP pyrophosphatase (non-canonical NTP hydrolase)
MTLAELTVRMHQFVAAKGWYAADSDHPQTARNLAASLCIEAAEVLELFQWRESADPVALGQELADVLLYLLQLADLNGIDLAAATLAKLEHNAGRQWPKEPDVP